MNEATVSAHRQCNARRGAVPNAGRDDRIESRIQIGGHSDALGPTSHEKGSRNEPDLLAKRRGSAGKKKNRCNERYE
jgi:hypothetical protein